MGDTVLRIVQNVCKRVSIPVPSILVSSADPQVNQLQALLDEVGQDLVTRFKWQELTRRAVFFSQAQENQGTIFSLLAADPETIENLTLWDVTQQQPIWGPLGDTEYQERKTSGTGIAYEYKIMNSELLILPAPPAGHMLSAMYRTKTWLVDTLGVTFSEYIIADSDMPILDDKMITMGLIARWKEEKGLPYAEAARRFESMAIGKAAKSGTKRTLYLDGGEKELRPGIFIPAGSWPL